MRLTVLLAVALLLPLMQAGCTGPAGNTQIPGRHAFEARLRSNGQEYFLTFHGPERVLDRDGEVRLAYRLDVDGERDFSIFLDNHLRIARETTYCASTVMPCSEFTRHEWTRQGGLPPFGLALYSHVEDDRRIVDWGSRQAVEFPVEVDRDSTRVHISVGQPGLARPTGYRNQTLSFEPGHMLPDIQGIQTLLDYRSGSELPGADVWPYTRLVPEASSRNDALLPGSDEDITGTGNTLSEFYQAFEASQPAVAAAIREGTSCISRFSVVVNETAESLVGPWHQPAGFVIRDRNGRETHYRVTASRDVLGRVNYSTEILNEGDAPGSCDNILNAAWPHMAARDLATAVSVHRPSSSLAYFEFRIVGRAYLLAARPPSLGAYEYAAVFLPPGDGEVLEPHQIVYDGSTALLDWMHVPNDFMGREYAAN